MIATSTVEAVAIYSTPSRPAVSSSFVPDISIVATMYLSRQFLEEFLNSCGQALNELNCTAFEIILVNDGSPDDSLAYAITAKLHLPQLVVVDLSRNFGHHAAMQAGLATARGNYVFLIDCDLEVSPLVLVELHRKLLSSCSDMVYGYQEARKGGWLEKYSGRLFYKGFNALSDIKIPENVATERIMTRRFVDALLELGDKNLFLAGMLTWTGFQQLGMPITKKLRSGASSYTLMRRIGLMVNALSSFSAKPLTLLFNVGALITAISLFFSVYLVARKILFDDALLGFTSMMAIMLLSLGIITTGLGVIGIYLGKIFNQVQSRPTYIIRDIHR